MLFINSIMKNKYKLDNQQETLNIIKGSSETTCRTTFNLDILLWFIGFLEGDGCFIYSNKRLFFIITQNELIVLFKIKHFLSLGRVQKHGSYFRFIITKQKDVLFLINLISNLIIFNKTVIKINQCLQNKNVEKLNLINFNFFKSAWLSGFIDAEGCFYIRLLKRKSYKSGYQIRTLFLLDQKLLEKDILFFEYLKNCIGGYILNRKNNNFRLVLENDKNLLDLILYLKRYPLRSHKKSILFKHWLICWRIKNKKEITDIDIDRIKKIKSWRYSPPKYESI